ncbi:MAG: LysR family transcriptional regulator, partial [Acetobacteraceae bacterium]|nr:LysR family transcriptional regulator [Acetobacteraceae bacterium]
TSASQVGTHAPVLAGLAVTVSTVSWLPEGLRPLRPDEGLPPLPEFGIALLKARHPSQPVTDALAEHIEASFTRDSARLLAAE